MARSEKVAQLRRALAPFAGGRFEVSNSGGASGMVFWYDGNGRPWFVGGFNRDGEALVTALNLTMELLAEPTPPEASPTPARSLRT